MLERIADGRTDLVFDFLAAGHSANSTDSNGVSLIRWCAYYGDVSAIKFLLLQGESLASLGANFDLIGASFHGHWRLCQFLLESGADVNDSRNNPAETPLHAALCKPDIPVLDLVVEVLLVHGANPNAVTKQGVETDGFMRDCRTKGETPLHRAAAFGSEKVIELLLDAGATIDAKDMNGDTPLGWASWYARPDAVLRKLCYEGFHVREDRKSMEQYLLGEPR